MGGFTRRLIKGITNKLNKDKKDEKKEKLKPVLELTVPALPKKKAPSWEVSMEGAPTAASSLATSSSSINVPPPTPKQLPPKKNQRAYKKGNSQDVRREEGKDGRMGGIMDKSEELTEESARESLLIQPDNKGTKEEEMTTSTRGSPITKEKKEEKKVEEAKKDKPKKEKKKSKKKTKEIHAIKPEVVAFFKNIEEKGWAGIEEEFNQGHRQECKELNRDTRYVLTFNVPPEGDFYDANKVEMPGVEVKFIVGSKPNDASAEETFWRMIYDSSATNIFVLGQMPNEKELGSFVPFTALTSKDFGKISVMNKKATATDRDFQAILEVLPDGCSNSIITRLICAQFWPDSHEAPLRRLALHLVRLLRTEPGKESQNTVVVCNDGISQSATFILLHSALSRLISNEDANIPELLDKLRSSRWGSIQTVEQYVLVHVLVADYFECKDCKLYKEYVEKSMAALKNHLTKKAKAAPKSEEEFKSARSPSS